MSRPWRTNGRTDGRRRKVENSAVFWIESETAISQLVFYGKWTSSVSTLRKRLRWNISSGHLLKWPFPHSRFTHFQCPKQKSKTTSEYKHIPNKWEIWPQKPLLITGKSFSPEEKWKKILFFPDFELLDSLSTHYHANLKKIPRGKLIQSNAVWNFSENSSLLETPPVPKTKWCT